MTPLKLLSLIYPQLSEIPGQFAVAGGLAASIYRPQPRLTSDIDIALNCGSLEKTKLHGTEFLQKMGLKVSAGWIAQTENLTSSPIALLIGHSPGAEYGATVDIILPTFAWIEPAISRAQHNLINFGFASLPTLTPEDVIIAKAYALHIEPNRFKDLDDISSILQGNNQLDFTLIVQELSKEGIGFPASLKSILPEPLQVLLRG